MDAGTQRLGMAILGLGPVLIKHLRKRQVTVHGLDFGIPAGITGLRKPLGIRRDTRRRADGQPWLAAATHKRVQSRHSGMDAGIQRPGMAIYGLVPVLVKHLGKRQVTVHGLDSGIPAGMTGLQIPPGIQYDVHRRGPGSQAGAWEPAQREKPTQHYAKVPV